MSLHTDAVELARAIYAYCGDRALYEAQMIADEALRVRNFSSWLRWVTVVEMLQRMHHTI